MRMVSRCAAPVSAICPPLALSPGRPGRTSLWAATTPVRRHGSPRSPGRATQRQSGHRTEPEVLGGDAHGTMAGEPVGGGDNRGEGGEAAGEADAQGRPNVRRGQPHRDHDHEQQGEREGAAGDDGIQLGSPLVGTFAQSGERLRVEAPARPSRSNAPSGRPGGGGQRLGEDRPVKTTVLPAASSSSRGGCTAPAAQYSRPALPPVPAGREYCAAGAVQPPRLLELAAGRTVVLTGRSSPKRWPPPPGRPDGAFERLGRAGASTRRRSPDCAKVPTRGEPSWMPDEAWQEWPAAGEAEAWERRSSTMVSGE